MKQIAEAILKVMDEIDSIDKNSTVGTGSSAYKGVSDKDVKQTFKKIMKKHGLCILPISVTPTTKIDRWEEATQWGSKMKQSIFTEVRTKYLLLHISGESIELEGLGHGVDPQDKSAGKATTYALKYTLLYTFLTPTGEIDDTDNDHSDDKQVPENPVNTQQPLAGSNANQPAANPKPWLNKTEKDGTITQDWQKVESALKSGNYTVAQVESKYRLSKDIKTELEKIKPA